MSEYEWFIQERKRKIVANDLMLSGQNATSHMQNGIPQDTTDETIATNKEHIAEIEDILIAANVPFEG